MSAVLEPKADSTNSTMGASPQGDMSSKLAFSKKLQAVTNRIHSTSNVDEIMLDVTRDICQLFDADRLTVYMLSDDGQAIISKVKSGLNSFKDIKLPLSESSIAGCCALNKRFMNIKDVYDDTELKSYSPNLAFLKAVDQRTGYRTKQMMVAPILGMDTNGGVGDLAGVIQVINHLPGTPFTQLAEEGLVELSKTLAIAFKVRQQIPTQIKSKFEYLVIDNVISEGELELATRTARRKNKNVEDILIDEFQVKQAALGAALAKYFGVEYEAHNPDRVKPIDLLKNLKRDYCESAGWIAVDDTKAGIVVMTTDPEHVKSSRVVENIFPKSKVVYKVSTGRDFVATLAQLFGTADGSGGDDIGDMLSSMDDDPELQDAGSDEMSAAADNELVKLVNKIIIDAYNQGASDIHIEPLPGKGKTGIRFRKDGSLAPYIEIPSSYRSALCARLKIMCDLDISEKRKPQDGKIKFKKYGPLDIELRVATIPTTGGVEDIVMRILAAGEPIPLDKLGLTSKNKSNLVKAISKPYGLFFVCGPTGSGKTTTLHSVLGSLNKPDTKIWTAEDPVEITQKGLRQVQVNKKVIDFPAVMKAFLRADPDIIMVGEMRDAETTHIGIEASLTGHLVFATLHTNSAPEAIIRLLDMGMDPFNFSDALVGILAQRLAKRLCGKCKTPYNPDQEEMKQFMHEYTNDLRQTPPWVKDAQGEAKKLYEYWLKEYATDGKLTFYKPVGCDACGNTGYKGRAGLHELMVASDPVKKLVQEKARVSDIFVKCVEEGMSTLKMDGMDKVMMGITDMKQVRSVCVK